MPKGEPFHFEGFENPTTTPVPDIVFDRLLARLGEAELKALLYIVRRTFGFKRDRDPISFNQFLRGITTRDGRVLDEGCGVRDRTTLSKALRSLETKGIIVSQKGVDERGENTTTVYSLRFKNAAAEPEEVVGNPYHPGRDRPPPVVGPAYPQHAPTQDEPASTGRTERRQTGRLSSNPRKPRAPDRLLENASTPNGAGIAAASAPAVPPPTPLRARLSLQERRRYDADRRRVVDYLSDFARELGDAAPLASSVSRAVNLMRRAGVDLEAFVEALYHARAVTKERWAAVRKESKKPGDPFPRKEAMAYFFAELEHALGLRALPQTPAEHAARKAAEQDERRRDRDRRADWTGSKSGRREWVQTYKPGEGLPAIGVHGGEDDGA